LISVKTPTRSFCVFCLIVVAVALHPIKTRLITPINMPTITFRIFSPFLRD
jgi:hypothetical protein